MIKLLLPVLLLFPCIPVRANDLTTAEALLILHYLEREEREHRYIQEAMRQDGRELGGALRRLHENSLKHFNNFQ